MSSVVQSRRVSVLSILLLTSFGVAACSHDLAGDTADPADQDILLTRLSPGALTHYALAQHGQGLAVHAPGTVGARREALLGPSLVGILVSTTASNPVAREIERLGGIATTITPVGVSAQIPPAALAELAELNQVRFISALAPEDSLVDNLDDSIRDTKTDRVHLGTGIPTGEMLTGAGVVVGVVDRLGDIAHQDFRNPDGSTRIVSLWNQRVFAPIAGESPPAAGYGVEYTESNINDDIRGVAPGTVRLLSTLRHGTHVSGIAGSNGRALGNFVGMAPDADLIWVNRLGSPSNVVDGVSYIFDTAATLGRPAVVNIASGQLVHGPHDGTRPYSTMLDSLVGPGRLIAVAAGNDGSNNIHASDTLASAGDEDLVDFVVIASGFAHLDFWYDGDDALEAFIRTPNGDEYGPFAVGAACTGVVTSGCATDPDEGYIRVTHRLDPLNSDHEIDIQLDDEDFFFGGPLIPLNTAGTWTVRLRAIAIVVPGVWHAWSSNRRNATFSTFVDRSMTMHQPSMASRVIAVGAHLSRRDYVDVDGFTRIPPGIEDDIWSGSSHGPSRDPSATGQKPELTAPGVTLISALSSTASPPSRSLLLPDLQHFANFGTSMAAPHVAGALALMLSVNPTLTPEEAEGILTAAICIDNDTCEDDPVTTPIPGLPNDIWGNGKLDTLAAMQGVFQSTFGAFPSLDPTDGRMITVSGQGLATIDQPWLVLRITAASSSTTLTVDIFDGDVGGQYDVVVDTVPSCYRLIADGDGTVPDPSRPYLVQAGDSLVIERTSSDVAFSDNAFGTLYSGPHDPVATAPSGNFFYRLAVVQGPTCSTPDPLPTSVNGFKVRATGQVSIRYGQWGFIAGDNSGPFVSPVPFIAPLLDTSFDGTFSYFVRVSRAMTSVSFVDADADHLLDADSPGVATGANAVIRYDVSDPGGTLLFTTATIPLDPTPSGNFDVLAPGAPMDIETNVVPLSDIEGFLHWRWFDMFTENNIFVAAPGASPIPLEVFAAPVRAFRFSAARSQGFFGNTRMSLDPFLPIVLGEETLGGSSVLVSSDAQARVVLQPGGGRVDRFTRAYRNLLVQLLAAKLNIAFTALSGEDFESEFVYGTDQTVGDVIAEADALVAALADPAAMSSEERSAVIRLAILLDTANQGGATPVGPEFGVLSLSEDPPPVPLRGPAL